MMQNALVITGMGIVSPYGEGNAVFRKCYNRKRDGIKPLSVFQSPYYRHKLAGEASDFNPQNVLGKKGLRTLDRATLLLMEATKFLLQDTGIRDERGQYAHFKEDQIGMVTGSCVSLKALCEFDQEVIKDPQYVSSVAFSNAVMNAPASNVAIRNGTKALCITIANGTTSSLDALGMASGLLLSGRASLLLAGGAQEISEHAALFAQKSAEYHNTENPILGEAAAMFAVERRQTAEERGTKVLAEMLAYSSVFYPEPQKAIELNLQRLQSMVGDETFCSITDVFSAEENGVDETIQLNTPVRLHTIRDKFGFLSSATGAVQVASALVSDDVKKEAVILFDNLGWDGNCSSLLLKKCC